MTTDEEQSYAELAEMWLMGERSWWNTFCGSEDAQTKCQAADIMTANTYAMLALRAAIVESSESTQPVSPRGVLFPGSLP